jgi:hypothetical protein
LVWFQSHQMCPLVVDEEEVAADMGVDMGEWEDHHMTHLILVPQLILRTALEIGSTCRGVSSLA